MPVVTVPMMLLGWVVTQFWHCAAVGVPDPGHRAIIAVSLDESEPLKLMSALAELGGLLSKLRPMLVIPTGPLQ
jgi:hypothetical protein